ncbi:MULTISPECIES: hypothetical protein [Oceanithermus]|uniref:Uncharacterized protein n=2 Tax=Oceanithermus desulfurans TaxID=227924 RepID=A0A511RL34_9DEIN|nr:MULTISPECIES: hypothetical protein [Oceanithermus]MBB6029652.1 hypothetical protein [Oceanithermus desulfurans]GEM89652.1 hypothetical protein ODE01S_10860 [Oceanithermus desulfurans NBRC 100063]
MSAPARLGLLVVANALVAWALYDNWVSRAYHWLPNTLAALAVAAVAVVYWGRRR